MRRSTWLLLVLILALIAATGLTGCGPADGSGAKVVEGGDSGSGDAEPVSDSDEAKSGTRSNPLPLGTTAEIGEWEVKITGVTLNADDIVKKANEFNDPPADGHQYVLVSVDAKYVGDDSGTFWTDMISKFIGSGGNTFDKASVVLDKPIDDTGETFPGASVSGNLAFEVASDQLEGGAIIMEELSFDDTRVFFAIE